MTTNNKNEAIKKQIDNFKIGIIVVCPECKKIDINPLTHFKKCNPAYEQHRQEQKEKP